MERTGRGFVRMLEKPAGYRRGKPAGRLVNRLHVSRTAKQSHSICEDVCVTYVYSHEAHDPLGCGHETLYLSEYCYFSGKMPYSSN